jgi:hypothetical protein
LLLDNISIIIEIPRDYLLLGISNEFEVFDLKHSQRRVFYRSASSWGDVPD